MLLLYTREVRTRTTHLVNGKSVQIRCCPRNGVRVVYANKPLSKGKPNQVEPADGKVAMTDTRQSGDRPGRFNFPARGLAVNGV